MAYTIIKKIGYIFPFILPALWVWGYYEGGIWNYASVSFAFVGIPLLDFLLGVDKKNIPKEKENEASQDWYYAFILYSWAAIQLSLLVWACWVVAISNWQFADFLGFLLSTMTVMGGIGITVAHELGHKNNYWEQFLAKILLDTVFYRHFFIEHNRGHHVNVATPKDPATSKANQNVYAFWWQSVWGGIKSAWHLEKRRLERKGKSIWSKENDIWACIAEPLVLILFITLLISWWENEFLWEIPAFFLLQSLLSFSLLEVVNYIEHYGINRKILANGKYERVEHLHSWNASHLLSNFFLFQLQRHSDHHAYANRRYQVLRHFEDSPQLPAGYPTMILIALVPPLWFSIMNKRLNSWRKEVLES
ncbi:MAG: alkane 1-monooxygenase [Thermonemataceae bacterium]|nr:alkane 1-monooxygenase [Thermonemataceae bacterium]